MVYENFDGRTVGHETMKQILDAVHKKHEEDKKRMQKVTELARKSMNTLLLQLELSEHCGMDQLLDTNRKCQRIALDALNDIKAMNK